MTGMPPGWCEATLADVARWGSGGTPTAGNRDYYGGSIPWAVIGDLTDGTVSTTRSMITEAGLAESSAKMVPAGAVLVAMYGSIGKLGVTAQPMATNQAIAFAVPNGLVLAEYLFLYLLSQRHELDAAGKGATQRNISQTILKAWPIQFPQSISEQRRIVDILEDHLSRLDAAESGIKSAQVRTGQWRRSLLLQAVLGWSASAIEALDRSVELAGPVAPKVPLPPQWRWRKWRDIGSSQNGKAFPSSDYSSEGIRLLRPGNMAADGSLEWSSATTRSLPIAYASTHNDLLLETNDLVINLTAQSLKDDFLGRVCIVSPTDSALLNQRIARLRTSDLTPDFALLVFRSPLFREYVRSLNTGSLIQHMFTKQLNEFWLPVPPRSTQITVSAKVSEVLDIARRTSETVNASTLRGVALRRSLLAAAFSGRLTGRSSDLDVVEEMAGV